MHGSIDADHETHYSRRRTDNLAKRPNVSVCLGHRHAQTHNAMAASTFVRHRLENDAARWDDEIDARVAGGMRMMLMMTGGMLLLAGVMLALRRRLELRCHDRKMQDDLTDMERTNNRATDGYGQVAQTRM